MKESQVQYILEKEEEKRYATVSDCWYKIYTKLQTTKAMPAKQILQNHSLVYSVLSSWREFIFRLDEMRTMFCISLYGYRQTCFTLWSALKKSLAFIEP